MDSNHYLKMHFRIWWTLSQLLPALNLSTLGSIYPLLLSPRGWVTSFSACFRVHEHAHVGASTVCLPPIIELAISARQPAGVSQDPVFSTPTPPLPGNIDMHDCVQLLHECQGSKLWSSFPLFPHWASHLPPSPSACCLSGSNVHRGPKQKCVFQCQHAGGPISYE